MFNCCPRRRCCFCWCWCGCCNWGWDNYSYLGETTNQGQNGTNTQTPNNRPNRSEPVINIHIDEVNIDEINIDNIEVEIGNED